MPGPSLAVRVPATSANLGPGFDCLGMALNLWNELSLEPSNQLSIHIEGEGENSLPRDESNIIFQAIKHIYLKRGEQVPRLYLRCKNKIPLYRGLGSSAAAIVSGLLAANFLLGRPMKRVEILQEAAAIEGHADNVAPALFGGCQVVFKEDNFFLHSLIPMEAKLKAILFIPDFEIPTNKSRAILSPMLSRADVVYSLSRVALLATAMTTERLSYLKWATQDKLHQPQRQTLFPAMGKIFQAALSAGALGVFLSGSGSTILALAENATDAIGKAMVKAGAEEGLKSKIIITTPTPRGAYLSTHKGE